jgi:transcription elongation factor SPT6
MCPHSLFSVKKVATLEELRDVYQHFLLYYGSDVPKMRLLEKVRLREEAAERGTEEPEESKEEMKHATRKSGYTICLQNKLGEELETQKTEWSV